MTHRRLATQLLANAVLGTTVQHLLQIPTICSGQDYRSLWLHQVGFSVAIDDASMGNLRRYPRKH